MSVLATALLAVAVWWGFGFSSGPVSRGAVRRQLEQARTLLQQKPAEAERIARDALRQLPDSPEGLLVAGQAAILQGRLDEALKDFERLPESGDLAPSGWAIAASQLQKAGRLAEAETWWLKVLRVDASPNPRIEYAKLLCWSGRFAEGRQQLEQTLEAPGLPVLHLVWAARPDVLLDPRMAEQLGRWREAYPSDPLLPLGLGAYAEIQGRWSEAEARYAESLALSPVVVEAQLRQGRRLLESSAEQWSRWLERLSPETLKLCQQRSEYWVQVGLRAQAARADLLALQAFVAALEIDPLDRTAAYQAGILAERAGGSRNADEILAPFAARMLARSRRLDRLKFEIDKVTDRTATPETLRDIAALYAQLGHKREGIAWYRQAILADGRLLESTRTLYAELSRPDEPLPTLLAGEREEVTARLTADTSPRTPEQAFLAALLRRERPDVPLAPGSPAETGIASHGQGSIHFREEAKALGIEFRYQNAHDPARVAMRMQEFTGGGAGWLDYDRDGRLDLFAVQGTPWPAGQADTPRLARDAPAPTLRDQLYRQTKDRFQAVTTAALPPEGDYGQGVAAGDINEDGFPDLFVGNVGSDRLLRNLGDGTFEDISAEAGITARDWTTSVCIADLTGDGLSDLYAATYAEGANVYTEICRDQDGTERSCKPTIFSAAPDRFYVNAGDGSFREEAAARGFIGEDGRGLGVVAFDADDSGRLSLFVANDGTANFFFGPVEPAAEPAAESASPSVAGRTFEEQGLAAGLAFDEFGKPSASMGIAAGDVDRNGFLDFLVTNYYLESNTFYSGQGPGQFLDLTRDTGLREPSLHQLGFGTQFGDFDLDGWEDALVSNGHEGDYRDLNIPFAMPPQVFRNRGREGRGGTFEELPSSNVGRYFEGEYLGRGLTKGDWNRDGMTDVVITHLDAPLALLTNTSRRAGAAVGVTLVGTTAARIPIGTRVTVNGLTQQLTGGDGYLASNERRLIFAVGDAKAMDLEVRWPSGATVQWKGLPVSADLVLVEGAEAPLPLPR